MYTKQRSGKLSWISFGDRYLVLSLAALRILYFSTYQFDHMSEPRHRKLLALGIASLVSTGRPEVLERVPNEIFNLWTDVLFEVRESRSHTEDGEDGSVLKQSRWCSLIRCIY